MSVDPSTAIEILANKVGADTVRMAQVKPRKALFDSEPFIDDVLIIICVRNLACIESSACIYKGL